MTHRKPLVLTILALFLTLCAGCISTAKNVPVPYQEGVDIVWLEKGQDLKAPARGVFFSDNFAVHELAVQHE